jgi:hypothetical protein
MKKPLPKEGGFFTGVLEYWSTGVMENSKK